MSTQLANKLIPVGILFDFILYRYIILYSLNNIHSCRLNNLSIVNYSLHFWQFGCRENVYSNIPITGWIVTALQRTLLLNSIIIFSKRRKVDVFSCVWILSAQPLIYLLLLSLSLPSGSYINTEACQYRVNWTERILIYIETIKNK